MVVVMVLLSVVEVSVRSAPAAALLTRAISSLLASDAECAADDVCDGVRVRRDALRTFVVAVAEEVEAAAAMGSKRWER